MDADAFRYDGKRALVVGGGSGMGAATAALVQALGGEVVVMDIGPALLPGATTLRLDLRDKTSIDAAVDECGGPVHALFSCAGAADGTPGIEKINFIGHRHLIDRMVDRGHLVEGAAIGMISSTAGLAWDRHLGELDAFLATDDFDAAVAWIEQHPDMATYLWSKEAVCSYVAREAFSLLQRGIRINAIMPGPTDTPLARSQGNIWLGFGADFREATGIEPSTPEQQASVLAFLCSDAASYVSGTTIISDLGYVSAGITRSFPPAVPAVEFLFGTA